MTAAFLLLLLLALGISWIIIHLEGYWYVKAAFITLTLYLTLSIFFSLENFKGWPTGQTLPEQFRIEWIVIQEPGKANGTPGNIYVWVSDIDVEPVCYPGMLCLDNPNAGKPRAYALPYSTESHEQSLMLMEMIKNGEEIFGEFTAVKPDDEEDLMLENIVIHDFDDFPSELRKD